MQSTASTWILLFAVMATVSCETVRYTLRVPGNNLQCISETFTKNGTIKISYAVHHKLRKSETGEPVVNSFRVFFVRAVDQGQILSEHKTYGTFSFKNPVGYAVLKLCMDNYESKDVKITFEISSGLDVNDFGNLPLDNDNRSLNMSMSIVEELAERISSIREYARIEVETLEHSSRVLNAMLGITGYVIGIIFVVGCCQSVMLKKRLFDKKTQ